MITCALLRNLIYAEKFWLFCARCGTLKSLLTLKGSNSRYKLLSLVLKVNFLCLPGRQIMLAAMFVLVNSSRVAGGVKSMRLSGALGLNRLRIRHKILGQVSTLLPIDIDSLQQLDKMHGQSMDKIWLTQHI